MRLLDLAEKQLAAKDDAAWPTREIGRARRALEAALGLAVEHLKWVWHFQRHTAWLIERFPDGARVFYRLSSEPQARRLTDTVLDDTETPAAGQGFFYAITAEDGAGSGGSLANAATSLRRRATSAGQIAEPTFCVPMAQEAA